MRPTGPISGHGWIETAQEQDKENQRKISLPPARFAMRLSPPRPHRLPRSALLWEFRASGALRAVRAPPTSAPGPRFAGY